MPLPPELLIADGKILFDTKQHRIQVDGKFLKRVPRLVYNVCEYYAARPDTPIPTSTITAAIWGDTPNTARRLARTLGTGRRLLGDTLGDPATGAFRSRYKFGVMAMSQLGVILPWPDEEKALSAMEGALELNERSKAIRADGEMIASATHGEYTVLRELMLHQGEELPGEYIEAAVGFEPGSPTLDNTIASLEEKLGFSPWSAIEYIDDQGYRMSQHA